MVLALAAILLAVPAPRAIAGTRDDGGGTISSVTNALDQLDKYFIENAGQVTDGVRYYLRGNPSVAFRDDGVMFVVADVGQDGLSWNGDAVARRASTVSSFAYLLRFDGANLVTPGGRNRLPFNTNFFLGNDSANWQTDVPVFEEVVYPDLYDGIDLVYRPDQGGVKYEFVVSPGADPGVIKMRYEGVSSVSRESSGMAVHTPFGDLVDANPFSYQKSGRGIDCAFASRDLFSYGFDCASWDRSEPLVIDPLVYSSFIAGGSSESGYGVAVSGIYRAYVTGITYSIDFPVTSGAFSTTLDGVSDVFVLKMNEIGSLPFFVTFIGGGDLDSGKAIAVDAYGNAYVTGETDSSDFPTTAGAFSTVHGGFTDAFLTKLNVSGSSLDYSGYLGGNGVDGGTSIAVDSGGNATLVGYTYSDNFPLTPGAWRKTREGCDAFVTKVYFTGQQIVFSTFLGGDNLDTASGVAVDAGGNTYVTGQTRSSDFPVETNALQSALNGSTDAFVTELSRGGNMIIYSTYLGGNGTEWAHGIALDPQGSVYVVGETSSRGFPVTLGAWDTAFNGGNSDAFVAKIDLWAANQTLNYSTFIGGGGDERGNAIAVDPDGAVYITGETNSTNFPVTLGAYDPTPDFGYWNAFVTKIKPGGIGLAHSTYLGGGDNDWGRSIAVDTRGDFYVTGETRSSDFPTTRGAFSTTFLGGWTDGFITKIPGVSMNDLPDLMIVPGYIWFVPASPIPLGTNALIRAEVHNIGGSNATLIKVRAFDGLPNVTNQIGPDKLIVWIYYFFDFKVVDVDWLAAPAGVHNICIVVDPDNTINETNENNNQACKQVTVYVPPVADLVITAANMTLSPPSPSLENASIRVEANIWNAGAAASQATVVRFSDGLPPGPAIGADKPLASLPPGGSGSVFTFWIATPLGAHVICAFADPDNQTTEFSKANNLACLDVLVVKATMPDYAPLDPNPPSSTTVGISTPLQLSIKIANLGNDTTGAHATLAFYNSTTPASPFKMFDVPSIPAGGNSSTFTATWMSPPASGVSQVVADVDYGNSIAEWNESNNLFVWTITTVGGPLTSLEIGEPNYTAAVTFVKSSTPLDFSVNDQSGGGIRCTMYRVDGGGWINHTLAFSLPDEGEHVIEWYSEDFAGNRESPQARGLTVDNTAPVTAFAPSVGDFNESTMFNLSASDSGSGVGVIRYGIDGGGLLDYGGQFNLSQGHHNITYYSVDNLGNQESERTIHVLIRGATAPPQPPAPEANYKPIVAVVFAIVLIAAGAWASNRRPWKGRDGARARVVSFMLISLPFCVAEAASGAYSWLTAGLAMPPYTGAGAILDVGILMTGLAIEIIWAVRNRPPPARGEEGGEGANAKREAADKP